jgi:hypothetical protein
MQQNLCRSKDLLNVGAIIEFSVKIGKHSTSDYNPEFGPKLGEIEKKNLKKCTPLFWW